MKTKKVEVVKDRWSDGVALEISHNGWQTTSISNLDVEDLKRIRKVIRKAIRNHEKAEQFENASESQHRRISK